MLALGTQREASRDMVCQQAPAHEEEESAGTDDVAAEAEHNASDVGAAPAGTLMGSQASPADRGGGGGD